MNRRFPRWIHLRPPRDRHALTAVEVREHHAIRLALFLTAGAFLSGTFVTGIEPIPGAAIEHAAWVRQTLRPLVRQCPTIALLVRLIDLEGPITAWDDARVLRRHLRCLASEADRLAQAMPRRRIQRQPGRRT